MEKSKNPTGQDLVKKSPFEFVPTSFEEAEKYAKIIAASDLAPKDYKGKPANVLIAVSMGAEVGLKPLQAIQNIAVINSRPTVWGDAMLGIVQNSPNYDKIDETFDDSTMTATCKVWRRGNPNPHVGTFSEADAKKAHLWSKQGPWQQYPKRMLQLRARAFALRDGFADALKGMQSAEEQRDIIETTLERTPDVSRASAPAPTAPTAAAPPKADPEKEAATNAEPAKPVEEAETSNGFKSARFKVKKVTRSSRFTVGGTDTDAFLIYPDAEGAPRYFTLEEGVGIGIKKAKEEDREVEVFFNETDDGLRIEEIRTPEAAHA